MNERLRLQLEKHISDVSALPEDISRLLADISDVYDQSDVRLAELEDPEARLGSLIENNADTIFVLSEDGIIRYAGGSLIKAMGYERDEVIGTHSLRYVHPDDIERVRELTKLTIASPGVPMRMAYRRARKDGTFIWCEGTGTNMLHVPSVKGVVVNVRDISARMQAEMALKATEYKLSSLLKNSSDAITIIDENFRVVFAAESLTAITGFTPEDVHGKTFADFVHPDDKAEVEDYFDRVRERYGDPIKITYRSMKKDGSYFWAERISVNLLHDPVVRGIVSNYRDVTERRNYVQALELTNDRLQKANIELDKFVYSVSHDLRAPLASMLGVVNLMEEGALAESIAEYLQMLKGSIEKLDGFIVEVLNYSKNAGTELCIEPVDFAINVESIVQNLRFMEGRDRINITNKIETEGDFQSDRSRINVILGNLVSNAIRYSDIHRSGSFVEISVVTTEENAIITVADNGVGIPSDKQSKVYEMFYRLSPKSAGSGLGLYIVKEAVEKLNGEIFLESEEGKGTVFTVNLPNLAKK